MAAGLNDLHAELRIVDGLQICRWSSDLFEEMRDAGLAAVNCTCSIWDGFTETMDRIAEFKRWFREHADVVRPIECVGDIARAKSDGRVGIILGWQNTAALEDDYRRICLFADLGVRVVQLVYNTQNAIGGGCFDPRDGGLTDFGHEVVGELNRHGIVIDLSHVGSVTARDVVTASSVPVAFTHVCPAGLYPHPRNRTDQELRMVAEGGGMIGVPAIPWFLVSGVDSTIHDYVDAIEYTVGLVGDDHVGIGTDFMQDQSEGFVRMVLRDKGYGRTLTEGVLNVFATTPMPSGFRRISDFPRLTATLQERGWSERRIRKVMGENWIRYFGEVWIDSVQDRDFGTGREQGWESAPSNTQAEVL
jgi:membrane dipeptidase